MNKLIKIESDYFITTDDKIEKNDYYLALETIYHNEPKKRWVLYNLVSTTNGENPMKVIYSTQELTGVKRLNLINNEQTI